MEDKEIQDKTRKNDQKDKTEDTRDTIPPALAPITTWKDVMQHFDGTGNVTSPSIEIDYSSVVADIFKSKYKNQFDEEKNRMPKNVVYRLWERVFYSPEPFKYEFELQGLSKQQKEYIVSTKTNRRKYITSLTDFVLTAYRDLVVVNDRFVVKCFEHDLEKILTFVLENEKFFTINVSTEKLSDLYIILACDMSNIKIFAKMLPSFNIQHLEYAIRFATLDFLMMVWKTRRWIPRFDDYMKTLEERMLKKEWKQLQFFAWWRQHLPVV